MKDRIFDALSTAWNYTVGLAMKHPREVAILGLTVAVIALA